MQYEQLNASNAGRSELYDDMVARYGLLLTGKDLLQCLGFKNAAALRQARFRGHIGVPIFSLPNRKGVFAKTKDVAEWLELMSTQQQR